MDTRQKLFDTSLGDEVFSFNESIIIAFQGKRNVASTSALNGGYREDLLFAYNNSCGKQMKEGQNCPGLKAPTLEGHYTVIANELGLDPAITTGMGTAALMENMATVTKSKGALTVTAMVTAGVDVNGGRAGDPASYDELTKNKSKDTTHGTINIFLNINAKMPAGILFRAMMTATEAKTAALQELMANSCYSEGLATGSGTDSAIIIGNLDSELFVQNAGKHSYLGEIIGISVKEAVKEALDKQTGMNPKRQSRISYQAKRYGITYEKIKKYHQHIHNESSLTTEEFSNRFERIDCDPLLMSGFASYIHLIDQYRWGLLNEKVVHDACSRQLKDLHKVYNLPFLNGHSHDKHPNMPKRSFHESMISPLIVLFANLIETGN